MRRAAVAAPITPPPITSRSNAVRPSDSREAARRSPAVSPATTTGDSSMRDAPPRRPPRRARTGHCRADRVVPPAVVRRDLEDLGPVAIAEAAGVHRGAARPPGQQRDRPGGRAPHDHAVVGHLDVVEHGTGAAVEAAGAQGVEDAFPGSLRADPRPRGQVEARVMAVVGHERRADPAVLQQLVPVHGRQARPTSSSHPALNTSIPVTAGGSSMSPGRAPVQYGCARNATPPRRRSTHRSPRDRAARPRARSGPARCRSRARARRDPPSGGS